MGSVVQLKKTINNSYSDLLKSVEDKLILVNEKISSKLTSKVDLIQNSAISFSVCINDKYNSLDQLISELKPKFKNFRSENK